MFNFHDEDNDIVKKALERMRKEPTIYPPEMKTATRAEYVTEIRKSKKPGCPLFASMLLVGILGVAHLILGLL